jgi:hypothetical protein
VDSPLALRFGVVRPGGCLEVVATAEARIVRHELERRLGVVTLDLRVDGDDIGPWKSLATASWPTDVDHVIDQHQLWGDATPALTTLFGRTLESSAIGVRRRMLNHLGLLPSSDAVVDDDWLAGIDLPIRPTDFWIMVNAAGSVNFGDRALTSFRTSKDHADEILLDPIFDQIAENRTVNDPASSARLIQRLTAERDELRQRVAGNQSDILRAAIEDADALDHARAEIGVLVDRLARAEIRAS